MIFLFFFKFVDPTHATDVSLLNYERATIHLFPHDARKFLGYCVTRRQPIFFLFGDRPTMSERKCRERFASVGRRTSGKSANCRKQ